MTSAEDGGAEATRYLILQGPDDGKTSTSPREPCREEGTGEHRLCHRSAWALCGLGRLPTALASQFPDGKVPLVGNLVLGSLGLPGRGRLELIASPGQCLPSPNPLACSQEPP